MAPSLALYFSWGFMIPHVGRATAVVFVIALLMSLPTAYGYAVLSNRMPATGATYKWTSRLVGPRAGITIGICTTLYYVCFIPTQLAFLPVVGRDLARSSSSALFAAIMWGSLVLAVPLVYRGIRWSIDASIALLALEVTIVSAIAIGAFVASHDSRLSLAPLDPSRLGSGHAVVPALVLGVLAFTGYDAISTLADETKSAATRIPQATILALLCIGAFWIIASTLLSDAMPPADYDKAIRNGGFPLAAAAGSAFGTAGRDLVDVMALEAGFGLLIASTIGATRIIYAMGRDRIIASGFGTVHRRYKIPWHAVTAALVLTVVADLTLSLLLGFGPDISIWLANLVTFFALVSYLSINVCHWLLFRRHCRQEFRWFANGVVPALGLAVVGYFMYRGFFEALWQSGFRMGKSVVITGLALLAAGGLLSLRLSRRPEARKAARAWK
jgi:amino acid transporter